MDIKKALQKEFDQETRLTKKFLSLIPKDKFGWKPHPKSMDFQSLAVHLAELPGWVDMAINSNGIDFATIDWKPSKPESTEDLQKILEENQSKGKTALENADVSKFDEKWVLRNGEQVLADWTRYETIRHALDQIIHHRAQLGVFLRLNDIRIPGSYGPSADEMGM